MEVELRDRASEPTKDLGIEEQMEIRCLTWLNLPYKREEEGQQGR